jgi:succinyl-diaminopimelate desuccinylase
VSDGASVTALLELTERLCAIPSVSGTEADVADFVERWLRDRAAALDVRRIGNNVVARTSAGAERRVVLGGHLDTVPENGNLAPRRAGDTLHGLGSADMKGGIAVLLHLAAALARTGGDHDVTLVFYEGEEVADEHNGLRRLFAEHRELVDGDMAVLLEPTGGYLEAGCQGTAHVRATFTGRRAHSARPWKGVNAIHRAAPALARCAGHQAETVTVEGLEYREALQVVRVEGGVANNVVPDACTLIVNRRIAPARTVEVAITQVYELLGDADTLEVLTASPPAPPNLTHPLVQELVGAGVLGVRPKLGWTDVARFAAHGIPACNFGPGDPELAHTADERVDLADLTRCADVLGAFLGLRTAATA